MMFYNGKPSREARSAPLRHVASRVMRRASLPASELLCEESVVSSLARPFIHWCHFSSPGSPQRSSHLIHARKCKICQHSHTS